MHSLVLTGRVVLRRTFLPRHYSVARVNTPGNGYVRGSVLLKKTNQAENEQAKENDSNLNVSAESRTLVCETKNQVFTPEMREELIKEAKQHIKKDIMKDYRSELRSQLKKRKNPNKRN